jgi:uncharacterized membrane protein YeaQ/YmgE (transglycosylase-associated protein family)
MASILWTVLIGFIAGAIAKKLTPGRGPAGLIVTVCLGIAGAAVGTFLGQTLGWYRPGETAGLFGGIVGAVLVLVAFRAIARRD